MNNKNSNKITLPNELLAYSNIHNLITNKEYNKAIIASKKYLSKNPKDAEINHLLGIAYLQIGNQKNALKYCLNAININNDIPQYFFNYAECLRRDNQFIMAIKNFDEALKLQPNYPLAYYNRGCAHFSHGQYYYALQDFETALKNNPENPLWLSAYADVMRELGKYQSALKSYQKSLKIKPDSASTHANISALLLQTGQIEEAHEHSLIAVEIDPSNSISQLNLGCCLVQLEQLDEAMDAFANAYELNPDSVKVCSNIGLVWSKINDIAQALYWFRLALQKDPENIESICGLAHALRKAKKPEKSEKHLYELLQKHPNDYRVLAELGQTYWDQENADKAIKYYHKAIKLRPTLLSLQISLGSILSSAGKVDEAILAYEKALYQNPRCIPALSGMATSLRGKFPPKKAKQLKNLLNATKLRDGAMASIHSGLSYYYDGIKDYVNAEKHIIQANTFQWKHKQKQGWEYDFNQHHKHIKRLKTTFNKKFFQRIKDIGNPSILPVFIVGMPRSGTTLTEQILASHPNVLGIGEREFASRFWHKFNSFNKNDKDYPLISKITAEQIQETTKSYLIQLINEIEKSGKTNVIRVVDKMPDNYQLLGWLATLFPNAKFIHCKRDLRDVALSCWMTQFGAIKWSNNLEFLSHRINDYIDISHHWDTILPSPILDSKYEELVQKPKYYAKLLIEWLDLDWDENCLNFQKSKKLIKTASVTQVRKPIYTKSIARWKNYENSLKPLLETLNI